MSDKKKYGGAVWFVRGVPAELRAEVVAAAERAGMKVGAWVERALRIALEQSEGQGGAPASPEGQGHLAARVADLAATVEAVRILFEKHRRQDFPSVVERLERLEAQAVPAIPKPAGRALDAVEPVEGVKVPEKTKARPRPSGGAVKSNRKIPAEHLEDADRLQAGGMSYEQIKKAKGWTYNRSGLAKAVQRFREEKAGQGGGELTTAQLLQMADEAERTLPPIERVRRVGEMMATDEPATEVLKVLRGEPEPEPDQGS